MNKLHAYFAETGDNPTKLAERIGRAVSSITRPLNGERNASMDLALDVQQGTNGRVTAAEFLAICIDAKTAKRQKHVAPPSPIAGAPHDVPSANQARD
jgi:hypothetical protein